MNLKYGGHLIKFYYFKDVFNTKLPEELDVMTVGVGVSMSMSTAAVFDGIESDCKLRNEHLYL